MNLNEAVTKRIQEICGLKAASICDICLKGGMSPSAIYDLLHKRTKSPKIITVKRFCMGAKITMGEFFSPEYFDEYEE